MPQTVSEQRASAIDVLYCLLPLASIVPSEQRVFSWFPFPTDSFVRAVVSMRPVVRPIPLPAPFARHTC